MYASGGRVGGGIGIAAGFSGQGFMVDPVLGRWLEIWVLEGAPPGDLSAFAPNRFSAGAGVEPERNLV